FITLGLIYRGLNRRDAAVKAFKQVLDMLPADTVLNQDTEVLSAVYGNLAELHCEEGKVATAIGMLERLLECAKDKPERPRVLNWLGNCHAALRAHAQARRYYEEVLALARVSAEDAADARAGLAGLPIQR